MTKINIFLVVATPFGHINQGLVGLIRIKESYDAGKHSSIISGYNKKLSQHVIEMGDDYYFLSVE